jgi:hypothetical protein
VANPRSIANHGIDNLKVGSLIGFRGFANSKWLYIGIVVAPTTHQVHLGNPVRAKFHVVGVWSMDDGPRDGKYAAGTVYPTDILADTWWVIYDPKENQ